MNQKKLFLLLSFLLVVFLPIPSRLAYGLLIIFEMFFMNILGICFSYLIDKIKMNMFRKFLMPVFFVFFAVLFKQIVGIIFPMDAFVIGFSFYVPAVSNFMICQVLTDVQDLKQVVKERSSLFGFYAIVSIVIFLLRDLIGYGTITLPSSKGILELVKIQSLAQSSSGVFWASISGGLIVIAIICGLGLYVHSQFSNIEREERK